MEVKKTPDTIELNNDTMVKLCQQKKHKNA